MIWYNLSIKQTTQKLMPPASLNYLALLAKINYKNLAKNGQTRTDKVIREKKHV